MKHFLKAIAIFCSSVCLFACTSSSEKNNGTNKSDSSSVTNNVIADANVDSFSRFDLNQIKMPAGFSISVYANVPKARSMCWGEKGTLFVGNRDGESVYAVTDENRDGKADKVYRLTSGMNTPNGVAFRNGSLYIAEIDRIIRLDSIEDRLNDPPAAVVVYDKFPTEKHHGWKFIAFGPDDKLYVPVGAPCNICLEKDPIFASITRMNPDGSGLEVFANGVRNSVGFTWHPQTKQMWFTDNGRDMMGDDKPYCELNVASDKGQHFGYPFCHQGDLLDPEFGKGKKCEDYISPAKKLGPHVAPLGLRFYTATQFPKEYQGNIFIAEHGSWNRSKPIGYRIGIATLNGNTVTDYRPFAEGWLTGKNKVLGRPVDVLLTPDGSLLVSDDHAGVIYKISYKLPG